MAESEEELKSFLMKVKGESEKAGLKFKSQKTKIMAYTFISSWQIDGKKMESMTDFIFLGSKITVMVTAALKLRLLLLRSKAMINLDSILKSKDITLSTKIRKSNYGFSNCHVQM